MTSHLPPLLAGALLLIAGCSAQPGSHHHGGPAGTTARAPVLFDNLGSHHRSITTTSPRAQAYFDQGLRLAGPVVPIVAAAMGAFAEGRYEDVIRELAPLVDQLVRVGGSRAQRDLFEHTLLAAYLRAGRAPDARALLARRIDRQPSVPVPGAR